MQPLSRSIAETTVPALPIKCLTVQFGTHNFNFRQPWASFQTGWWWWW
jgi:hypothetical protein